MRQALAVLLLATFTSGCMLYSYGQFDPLSSGREFDEAQLRFTRLVRWNQWEKASEMVAPDSRERFREVMAGLEGVKFTDWETILVDMSKGLKTAEVQVQIEGYREATLLHASARMTQNWERLPGASSPWVVRPDVEPLAAAFALR